MVNFVHRPCDVNGTHHIIRLRLHCWEWGLHEPWRTKVDSLGGYLLCFIITHVWSNVCFDRNINGVLLLFNIYHPKTHINERDQAKIVSDTVLMDEAQKNFERCVPWAYPAMIGQTQKTLKILWILFIFADNRHQVTSLKRYATKPTNALSKYMHAKLSKN